MSLPSSWTKYIGLGSAEYGTPPGILASLLNVESGGNANATNFNSNGSIDRGPAQINNQAHPGVSDSQAYNPAYAIPWAAGYLSQLKSRYGSWNAALQAYNSGSPTGAPQYAATVLAGAKTYGAGTAAAAAAGSAPAPSGTAAGAGLPGLLGTGGALATGGVGIVRWALIGIAVVFGAIALTRIL